MESTAELTAQAIELNAARIASYVRRTPILEVDGADFGVAGVQIVFKLEFLQHAGSFKSRGAFTNMLVRNVPTAGVVAASGGNHGAAVAYAAMKLGIPATIFVPTVASPAKVEQIRAYGARLNIGGDRYADALAAAEVFASTNAALPIHAYDDLETLLGQAGVGVEIEHDAPDLDALLVAVGGGGLIGGIAAWYGDRTQLVGVEPELAPTLHRALAAGEPVDAPAGGIAADSLAPRRVGRHMFTLARFISPVLVSDAAIANAQRELWRVLRIVSEPGGATALAAVLNGAWRVHPGQTIGIVLCGANTTAVSFN